MHCIVLFFLLTVESEVSAYNNEVSPSNMMLTNGRSNNVDIFGRGGKLHAADDFLCSEVWRRWSSSKARSWVADSSSAPSRPTDKGLLTGSLYCLRGNHTLRPLIGARKAWEHIVCVPLPRLPPPWW